jgi:hypothetical protein
MRRLDAALACGPFRLRQGFGETRKPGRMKARSSPRISESACVKYPQADLSFRCSSQGSKPNHLFAFKEA